MRSMPKPMPPVGGMPISSAFRKSSSVWLASSSPCGQQLLLGLETLPLVDGVVELGVGVGHLPAVHEELETLYIVGIARLLLGQRGNLHRVIHDKGGLDQVLLRKLLEEQVQDIALLMALLELYMLLLGTALGLLQGRGSASKSTPAYFFTASTMVMRSKGLPRSISTPL